VDVRRVVECARFRGLRAEATVFAWLDARSSAAAGSYAAGLVLFNEDSAVVKRARLPRISGNIVGALADVGLWDW